MGLARITKILDQHSRIAIDTCVLIYYLEMYKTFGRSARAVIARLFKGLNEAVVSTVALSEVLVVPYREARELADRYYCLLQRVPNLRWIPVTVDIADLAAELRAKRRLGTPDAIHLATAIEAGATLFVTNDRDLPVLRGVDYLILGE